MYEQAERVLYTSFLGGSHPGELNQEAWGIEVSGLCTNPKTFT